MNRNPARIPSMGVCLSTLVAAAAISACGGGNGGASSLAPVAALGAGTQAGASTSDGWKGGSSQTDPVVSNGGPATVLTSANGETNSGGTPAAEASGATTPPPTPAADAMAQMIPASRLPLGDPGYATDRLQATSELPSPSDIGNFRTTCAFSHMAYDDPIVYKNQPGRSHLHVFFGNTLTNADSTEASIANSGNSTCTGGTINRSAYWVPAVIDTRDGTPIVPDVAAIYYKTGYNGIAPAQVNAFPQGLRMIAGDASNDNAGSQWGNDWRFKCIGPGDINDSYGPSIPNCQLGGTMISEVFFPQCWDGVNLDSPDHKSHMAYPEGGKCPASHPVPVPQVSFNIEYVVKEANAPLRWRLSSDTYDKSLPAGYSSHADWFNGWKPEIMAAWVRNCDQASKDCHSHLLGDGRAMY